MFKMLHCDGTSKLSHYLDKPLGLQEFEAPRISRQLEHEDGNVSLRYWPPLPPTKYSCFSILVGPGSTLRP
jgi:hypothetical protein